ncbi:MAG: prepilin peptidase [Promethearchaeota archaeon]
MDFFLGITTATFVVILLVIASIQDYQTKEVTNWVWLVGLFVSPITIIRIAFTGLWLVYGFQILIAFIMVIFGFRFGFLGGADGKAILMISLLYPWIILEPLWLLVAPLSILLGGFVLLGVHSLWLIMRNFLVWKRLAKSSTILRKPERKTYWLNRSLSELHAQEEQWNMVEVPLILYFCIVFVSLLILTTLL